jgi:integrase
MKGCRPLTASEIATVEEAFVRTRDKALFILGLKTGLRISELGYALDYRCHHM